jgi:hypothetical protein
MPSRQAEPPGAAYASRSGPAAARRRIVASCPAVQRLRPGIVDRPGRLEGLMSVAYAPVVLVSAPAG